MTKRQIIWFITNFGVLTIFVLGNQMNNGFLITIGNIGFWFAAIVGTIILLGLIIYDNLKQKIDFKIYLIDGSENKKEVPDLPKNVGIMDIKTIKRTIEGSVPYTIDLGFDVLATGLMVILGYTWLPIFYIIHIFGLYEMKKKARNFLQNGEYYTFPIEEIEESEETKL